MVSERTDGADSGVLVDCDLHTGLDAEAVVEYLPRRYEERGLTIPGEGVAHPHGRSANDEYGEGWSGERTPENMKKHHLDEHDVDAGIITGSTRLMGIAAHPNSDYAHALAKAHNEWIAKEWVSTDDRLYGSILVTPQTPQKSADLIREYGDRPEFVQVMMGYATEAPYGKQRYWPIYEAAVEMDLPVAIHPAGRAGIAPPASAAGHTSTYFETHNMLPQTYMGHLNSLILEGAFVEYPDLTFVFVEGGIGWVPHLMWRMDKNWKGLREQTPWVSELPSEYVRRHARFTTQPIEEPERPEHLLSIFEMMHAEETLMFSSDFPHWDGDDPDLALPNRTPEDLHRRVMSETATDLYDLRV